MKNKKGFSISRVSAGIAGNVWCFAKAGLLTTKFN